MTSTALTMGVDPRKAYCQNERYGMRATLLVTIIALAGVAGCRGQSYATDGRLDNGLVIVLSVGLPQDNRICQYLAEDGVDWAIETDDLRHLVDQDLGLLTRDVFDRKGASLIAERIVKYQESYPERPVVLVTQGLGGQIGIDAVSSLGDRQIDGLVMVVPDVAEDTALDEALKHSRRGIVNLYRPGNIMPPGFPHAFGTSIDPNWRPPAGTQGFQLPSSASRIALYRKLHQVELLAARPADEGAGQEDYVAKLYHEYVTPFITSNNWATTARGMR